MFRSHFHKHEDHSKLETHLNTMRRSPTMPLTTTSVIHVSTCVTVPSTTGIWHFTLSHSVISLCLQEVCLNELHFTAVTNCHSEFLIACGSLWAYDAKSGNIQGCDTFSSHGVTRSFILSRICVHLMTASPIFTLFCGLLLACTNSWGKYLCLQLLNSALCSPTHLKPSEQQHALGLRELKTGASCNRKWLSEPTQ